MSRALPLAGFQVTLSGRFWVTPEAKHRSNWCLAQFWSLVSSRATESKVAKWHEKKNKSEKTKSTEDQVGTP